MIPGARHRTVTRVSGLNPARSSQHPIRRILGLIVPFQASPLASIFKVRTDATLSPACKTDVVFMVILLSSGFDVGGKIAAVFLAGVKRGGLVMKQPARVLPRLAFPVPMKAKLSQNAGNGRGLFV